MSRLRQYPSRQPRRPFKRPGFTLIEMLVVVVMLSIVMGLSVGRISATISQQRVNRAAIALSNDIESAFSLATRDRKPVQISFNESTMQLAVSDAISGTVFRRTSLANFDLQPSNVSWSRDWVRVYPVGMANDSLSITIAATIGGTTYSQQVLMGRGGLVQIK